MLPLLLLLLTPGLSVASSDLDGNPGATPVPGRPRPLPSAAQRWFTTQYLSGDRVRHVLWTDKPVYWAGEPVVFSSATFDLETNELRNAAGYLRVHLLDASGAKVTSGMNPMKLPGDLPGGEFTLELRDQGVVLAKRRIEVRAERRPRLKLALEFLRDGYAPGDTASATLSARALDGSPAVGARVEASLSVGDVRVSGVVGEAGELLLNVPLPTEATENPPTLRATVTFDGVTEATALTVPLLTAALDIAVFPESGDLVAGLETVVFIEVLTPWGEPADCSAVIVRVDGSVQHVADVATVHEGRGLSTPFVPELGATYELRVTKPVSVSQSVPLPRVKSEGAHIALTTVHYSALTPIEVDVAVSQSGVYVFALSRVDKALSEQSFALEAGRRHTLSVQVPPSTVGVLRATLYKSDFEPVTERLLFVRPARDIEDVSVELEASQFSPGDDVKLKVSSAAAGDDATIFVSVTDESALDMPQRRRRQARLPAMVTLEPEVLELLDANAYLDYGSAESREALELLLGVQGWRRFVFEDVKGAYHSAPKTTEERGKPTQSDLSVIFGMRGCGIAADPSITKPAVGTIQLSASSGTLRLLAGSATGEVTLQAGFASDDNSGRVTLTSGSASSGLAGVLTLSMGPAATGRTPMTAAGGIVSLAGNAISEESPEWRMELYRRPPSLDYFHRFRGPADTTQTLLWSGAHNMSEPLPSFQVSDLHTSFRVTVDGVAADGTLFTTSAVFASVPKLGVELPLPPVLRAGDLVVSPLSVSSNAARSAEHDVDVRVTASGAVVVEGGQHATFKQTAQNQASHTVHGRAPDDASGDAAVLVGVAAGDNEASALATTRVLPLGFPVDLSRSGLLKTSSSAVAIETPETLIDSSLDVGVEVQLSVLTTLEKAVERLIRQPHGCFEQTSSTTYPMVLALRLLERVGQRDSALATKARGFLRDGYKKLLSFETSSKGFEWFGHAPGREALTAYGLMQFYEMADVFDVDHSVNARTRDWLLSRIDSAAGSFKRARKRVDSLSRAPRDITDAYILFALTSILGDDAALAPVLKNVASSKSADPYFLALLANSLLQAGRPTKLPARLAALQGSDGAVQDAETSITGSRGVSLDMETTALCVLAWRHDADAHMSNIVKAADYLASHINQGSTQATILALKALIAYDELLVASKSGGTITLSVDGRDVQTLPIEGNELQFAPGPVKDALRQRGSHDIVLTVSDAHKEFSAPFLVHVCAHVLQPQNPAEPRVKLETALTFPTPTTWHASGEVRVSLTAVSEAVSMPIAIIGLPAGVVPRFDRLRELRQAGDIAAFELQDGAVVLYWRGLAPGSTVSVAFDVEAAFMGEFEAQPSRAYPYYEPEQKWWADPLSVSVGAG